MSFMCRSALSFRPFMNMFPHHNSNPAETTTEPVEAFGVAALAEAAGGAVNLARQAAIVAGNAVPFLAYAGARAVSSAVRRSEVDRLSRENPDFWVEDLGSDIALTRREPLSRSTPAPLMPGYRGYTASRSFGRYPTRSRVSFARSAIVASRRKQARNFVKKTLRKWAEMKHIAFVVGTDFTNSGTLATNGVFQQISGMAQGTSSTTRVGNQVELNQVMYNLEFALAAGVQTGGAVRVIFFVDHQGQSQPTPATILAGAAAAGPWTGTDVHRTYNLDQVTHGVGPQRIRILADRLIEVNNLNSGGTATVRKAIRGKIRLGNIKEFFNGTTATDYQTNAVWCFIIGDTDSLDLVFGQIQTCYFDA